MITNGLSSFVTGIAWSWNCLPDFIYKLVGMSVYRTGYLSEVDRWWHKQIGLNPINGKIEKSREAPQKIVHRVHLYGIKFRIIYIESPNGINVNDHKG